MQDEINAKGWAQDVHILGVNAAGLEAGNAAAIVNKDLPWLQDTAAAAVWTSWAVEWRDVVIVDAANRKVGVYNLTVHDLADPNNYLELKGMLQAAAAAR